LGAPQSFYSSKLFWDCMSKRTSSMEYRQAVKNGKAIRSPIVFYRQVVKNSYHPESGRVETELADLFKKDKAWS
jgi:hypothetical protein